MKKVLLLMLAVSLLAACGDDGSSSSANPDEQSSSSIEKGSSSSAEKGSVVDERDGQTYKTVKIGDQWWFAENLNYDVPNSVCYDNSETNCKKYGRLYRWQEAVKGACPEGWFLPRYADVNELFYETGATGYSENAFVLISRKNVNWSEATDDYGFSAMMGGYFRLDEDNPENNFGGLGQYSSYWQEEGVDSKADYFFINANSNDVGGSSTFIGLEKFSVRCVKDENRDNFVQPCKTDSTDTCDYGTLTDERDGRTYKTVTIGKHTWMAENLNYEVENSWCYDSKPEKCETNGRLYSGDASLNACPSGWHLPGKEDWDALARMTGFDEQGWVVTGLEEWPDATDAYGLSVIPAGNGTTSGKTYINENEIAYFCGALDENECYSGWFVNSSRMGTNCLADNDTYAVRCVKD